MTSYTPPLRDIRFVLESIIDFKKIQEASNFADFDSEALLEVLEEYGRWVSEEVAPTNSIGDSRGATWNSDFTVDLPEEYARIYDQYVEAGWGAVPFEPSYGGGGFPWVMAMAMQELLCSANMAFSMLPLLTQGAIDLLEAHASEEQRHLYLPKMISGVWSGTMNLTEPDAGSDVGAVKTKAVKQSDGSYRITGTKIFISFGEHDLAKNIVHLVLARTPDAPAGTKGISCFIVPKYLVDDDGNLGQRNDVRCVSIEHKMGIRSSPTCVMSYGDDGGAVGYLIGEENSGMRYMFTMMNNARLSVGLQGVSLSERAYQQASQYARERVQGRAPSAPKGQRSRIIDLTDVRRMLMEMKAYTEATRALTYFEAAAIDVARHHPDQATREEHTELVEILTPLAKAWGTDVGCEVTSIGIQVYGGMGFIEESGMPQYYRDARITPIYEGTNGIQAMDLVGRKLPMRAGAAMTDYLGRIEKASGLAREIGGSLQEIADQLDLALAVARKATTWIMQNGLTNVDDALAASVPYQAILGQLTGAWMLVLEAIAAQAKIDADQDPDGFYESKVKTARFFAKHLLPKVNGHAAAVENGAALIFDVQEKFIGAQ